MLRVLKLGRRCADRAVVTIEAPDENDPTAFPALPPEAEAAMAALLAEQRRARAEEDARRRARRNLWLTHHWPDEYDRCAVVARRHVCRRCLALYPLALLVAAAVATGIVDWPTALDPWLVWVLCIPATIEFLAEKLVGVAYDARRQVVVTLAVAVALGRGLALELDERWSPTFWGPVVVFGSIWFLAAASAARRSLFEAALEASLRDAEQEHR